MSKKDSKEALVLEREVLGSQTEALAVKETTAISTEVTGGSWGGEELDSLDIKIPRLLAMQPLSQWVGSGSAVSGDILSTLTEKVVGARKDGVEVIPIKATKTWTIYEFIGDKWEFRATEPMNAENRNDPMEWTIDGKEYRRDRSLNFYVLLAADVSREAAARELLAQGIIPDTDDAMIPHVISFRRSSFNAGRDLATHFAKAAHFNLPAAVSVFNIGTEQVTGDKGFYFIFTVKKVRQSTKVEIELAKSWNERLMKSNVVVEAEVEPVAHSVTVDESATI